MKECPVCKVKGKLISDQFREILCCQTTECPIIKYEVLSVTIPHLGV